MKWFNSMKGYGFITPALGKDVFFHYSDLQGGMHGALAHRLEVGLHVFYHLFISAKGTRAYDIHA
ncbi:cold shock domain-containing protein [Streptomyces sp. NPDC087917]